MKDQPKPTTIDEDAMALAELIYDVFKEQQASVKITSGQNNAQPEPND